ncbi:MAG: hypothetical protein F6K47_06890 [Symploca sp. SIO2E6]|nr:hypothetical protein [Symploca sp. SIO2E6]
MPSPRKPPAYLRYFKARLKPLGRPGFWVSTIVLTLVLVATGYYWQHPELLNTLINNQATDSDEPTDEPTLSSEELAAIIADIDSSSVLLSEFDSTRALTTITQPNPKSKKKKRKKPEGLFSQFINQQEKTDSQPKSTFPILENQFPNQDNSGNPFIQSTPNLTNSGLVSGSNLLNNSLGEGLLQNSQNPSQDASSSTGGTVTTPTWSLSSPNVPQKNQSEATVNPWEIPTSNSSTTTNEAQTSSDNQQDQVSPPPFPYSGQTTSSPSVPTPSTTNFPRSRPKPSIYSNPYNSSLPSPSIPTAPQALPVTPVTPVVPSNYGQYSPGTPTQTNIVPNTESGPVFGETGLKPSQLDQSGFDASGN